MCIAILQDAELQQIAMMMEADKNDKIVGVNNLKRMYAKMGKNFTEAEMQQLNLSFAEGVFKQVSLGYCEMLSNEAFLCKIQWQNEHHFFQSTVDQPISDFPSRLYLQYFSAPLADFGFTRCSFLNNAGLFCRFPCLGC